MEGISVKEKLTEHTRAVPEEASIVTNGVLDPVRFRQLVLVYFIVDKEEG